MTSSWITIKLWEVIEHILRAAQEFFNNNHNSIRGRAPYGIGHWVILFAFFFVISQFWDDAGIWNSSLWNAMAYLSGIAITSAVDSMAM